MESILIVIMYEERLLSHLYRNLSLDTIPSVSILKKLLPVGTLGYQWETCGWVCFMQERAEDR